MADYLHDDYLYIYTDGSMYAGPRVGGMGILFVATDEEGHEKSRPLETAGHSGARRSFKR